MMGIRVFIESDGLKLMSDERDVMVAADRHDDVIQWCKDNGIDVVSPGGNYNHPIAKNMFKVNIWRIKDEKQRALFLLKWS